MPTFQTTAVTLLRRPLGEADLLAVLLAREEGKLRVVARATRKPQSKLAPLVQPFVVARVQIAIGKNLNVLTQGEVLEANRPLREDIRRFAYCSYMAEVADRAIQPDQPAPRFYDLLTSCFRAAARQDDVQRVAMYFELHAMRLLGFEPAVERCAACGAELRAGQALWEPAAGGSICRSCVARFPEATPLSADASLALARLFVCRPSQLPHCPLTPAARSELRSALRRFVLYHMECTLNTLDFIRNVEEAMPA